MTRAETPQPVRSVLGERFYGWQLRQDPADSWAECERHARNLLGYDGYHDLQRQMWQEDESPLMTDARGQGELFSGQVAMEL